MALTYEPIATTTLGSTSQSITFSSITGIYTDLRVTFTGSTASSSQYLALRFNGDTGTNYFATTLNGTGASANTNSGANMNRYYPDLYTDGSGVETTPCLYDFNILSYSGSTFKTCLTSITKDRNGAGDVTLSVGIWKSTSAITSLTVLMDTQSFAVGTRVTLYGIKAA
jgi:hypothetical protein